MVPPLTGNKKKKKKSSQEWFIQNNKSGSTLCKCKIKGLCITMRSQKINICIAVRWRTREPHLPDTLACGRDRVRTSLQSLVTNEVRQHLFSAATCAETFCLHVYQRLCDHQAVNICGTGGRMWCPRSSFGGPQWAGWSERWVGYWS